MPPPFPWHHRLTFHGGPMIPKPVMDTGGVVLDTRALGAVLGNKGLEALCQVRFRST
jgi:hypothetical protein